MRHNTNLIDEVLKQIPNKYMAVIIASRHARAVNDGLASSVKTGATKPTTMALMDIATGNLPKEQEALEANLEEEQEEEMLASPEDQADDYDKEDEDDEEAGEGEQV